MGLRANIGDSHPALAVSEELVLQVLQWEQWPHRCALDSLRILQQGLRLVLASKSEDGLLATWDLQCGQILHRWQARADMVGCLHSFAAAAL